MGLAPAQEPQRYVVGAVDIGGTKIAVGVVDRNGSVLSSVSLPTRSFAGWQPAVRAIIAALQQLVSDGGVPLRGIGIGCTGPVDPILGVVGRVALLPGWTGCPLVQEMSRAFHVPVLLENDADAAALAEYVWGAGRGASRFLYLTVSTGIGGGFLIDGVLYRGVDGSHPEMGHHTLDPLGPPCACGSRGCLESLASGTALESWFAEHDPAARNGISAQEIFRLADEGDDVARDAIRRLTFYLGAGIGNLINILSPDVIAVGGGVAAQAGTLLPAIRAAVLERCLEVPAQRIRIVAAELGSAAGLVGAAAVYIQGSLH